MADEKYTELQYLSYEAGFQDGSHAWDFAPSEQTDIAAYSTGYAAGTTWLANQYVCRYCGEPAPKDETFPLCKDCEAAELAYLNAN